VNLGLPGNANAKLRAAIEATVLAKVRGGPPIKLGWN
jgi:hypothetical protein